MPNPWLLLEQHNRLPMPILLGWLMLYLVVSILAASWVSDDANTRRLPQPFIWAVATFATFPWVFVIYMIWTRSPWYREGEG